MKLNENYVLRHVADNWIVLPIGSAAVNFNGMLTLNSSGVLLWKALEQGATRESLVAALTSEYIVGHDQAQKDVDEFLDKLQTVGCLEL